VEIPENWIEATRYLSMEILSEQKKEQLRPNRLSGMRAKMSRSLLAELDIHNPYPQVGFSSVTFVGCLVLAWVLDSALKSKFCVHTINPAS
jgi:hypothetical protein